MLKFSKKIIGIFSLLFVILFTTINYAFVYENKIIIKIPEYKDGFDYTNTENVYVEKQYQINSNTGFTGFDEKRQSWNDYYNTYFAFDIGAVEFTFINNEGQAIERGE